MNWETHRNLVVGTCVVLQWAAIKWLAHSIRHGFRIRYVVIAVLVAALGACWLRWLFSQYQGQVRDAPTPKIAIAIGIILVTDIALVAVCVWQAERAEQRGSRTRMPNVKSPNSN